MSKSTLTSGWQLAYRPKKTNVLQEAIPVRGSSIKVKGSRASSIKASSIKASSIKVTPSLEGTRDKHLKVLWEASSKVSNLAGRHPTMDRL